MQLDCFESLSCPRSKTAGTSHEGRSKQFYSMPPVICTVSLNQVLSTISELKGRGYYGFVVTLTEAAHVLIRGHSR